MTTNLRSFTRGDRRSTSEKCADVINSSLFYRFMHSNIREERKKMHGIGGQNCADTMTGHIDHTQNISMGPNCTKFKSSQSAGVFWHQIENLTSITSLQIKTLYNKSPPDKFKLNILETCQICYTCYICFTQIFSWRLVIFVILVGF